MSETTPPIPKSGGSGPFVLAAIVMLLLMGGLIFWKMKSGGEAPKAQETPPPSATQNTPTLDEAPPPPPPEASDSAAPPPSSTAGTKKVASTGGNGGPCGVCSGEPNAGLNSALSAKAAQSRSCYEHALRQNSTLTGRMSINIKINQQGQVCSSQVTKNELGDPSVANCILGLFRGSSFPAPSGGCVEANVPLNFTPKT